MNRLLLILITALLSNLITYKTYAETINMEYGYCDGLYNTFGMGLDSKIGAAIKVPAEQAAKLSGSKLTKISIAIGSYSKTDIDLFITNELGGQNLYSETAKVTKKMGWNEFTLVTPYDVTGEAFAVGYTLTPMPSDKPIGFDNNSPADTNGSFFYINNEWFTGSQIGYDHNITIKLLFEGVELPDNNIRLDEVSFPYFFGNGTATKISGRITNLGGNKVSSIEISYTLGNNAPVNKTIEITPFAYSESAQFTIDDAVYNGVEGNNIAASLSITKVNGNDDPDLSDNHVESSFWSAERSFNRMVVVEEGTGTWCGYCPSGIVGMEYMNETYPESFIGIAVHSNDVMESATYIKSYPAEDYPTSNINRRHFYIKPRPENLEYYYNIEHARASYGNVEITGIEFNAEHQTVKITTNTEFALNYDGDADFKLAYVLLENNVGPYIQTNYYADGNDGEMGGWENLGEKVSTIYNEVARDIFNYSGIRHSVEKTIVAGQKYQYSYTVNHKNVSNIDNMDIVVLLIEASTGEIINADKVNAKEMAGVNNIVIDENENNDTIIFNLQGIQVSPEHLSPGLYIKVSGKKTEKILIQ